MSDTAKNFPAGYSPEKVWRWDAANGGEWASINRPTSGARDDSALREGAHPFQLYSLATPNGVKVTVLFEELLEAGYAGAEYDAWPIEIGKGQQFGQGFVDLNPNSKIPTLLDKSDGARIRVFESGAILTYLAEKFGVFLPTDRARRAETFSWLFWQVGSAPYLGGGFGHFYHYAPMKIQYAIDRFAMETKRQLDVLDKRLAASRFLAGDDYTIADIAVWPWYGALMQGKIYGDGATFLDVAAYAHVKRWTDEIAARPAVRRGRMVNRTWGDPAEQAPERHSAADFTGKAV